VRPTWILQFRTVALVTRSAYPDLARWNQANRQQGENAMTTTSVAGPNPKQKRRAYLLLVLLFVAAVFYLDPVKQHSKQKHPA
jgi:hypothetical protein